MGLAVGSQSGPPATIVPCSVRPTAAPRCLYVRSNRNATTRSTHPRRARPGAIAASSSAAPPTAAAPPRLPPDVAAATAVLSAGDAKVYLLGVSHVYWVSLLSSLFWGAPIGLFVTLVRQLTQEHTAPEMMGRAMGVLHVLSRGTLPLVSFGLLWLTKVVSPSTVLVLLAGLVGAVALGIATTGELRRS